VITGSYNWTNNARLNNENIIVINGDSESVDVFLQEFETLLKKYGHTVTNLHLKPLEVVSSKLAIPSETEDELEFFRLKRNQRTKRLSGASFFGLWLAIIGIAWLFIGGFLKQVCYPQETRLC
jgi:phosphatidylserine/phosphatidylglycerophosphate/cardiolipin synthase-like enzyme